MAANMRQTFERIGVRRRQIGKVHADPLVEQPLRQPVNQPGHCCIL